MVIAIAFCLSMYYLWCPYHPTIHIQIGDSSTGKDSIRIEAPKISIAEKGIARSAANVELKVTNITMQHEFLSQYVRDKYTAADIKLDIKTQDDQTILRYYGTVTNMNHQNEKFEKILNCDFVLDAEIKHE